MHATAKEHADKTRRVSARSRVRAQARARDVCNGGREAEERAGGCRAAASFALLVLMLLLLLLGSLAALAAAVCDARCRCE